MRDVIGADQAAAAAAVVDHDGAELRLDPLGPDPTDHVVHAGWDRWDHQANGAGGVALLCERGRGDRCRQRGKDEHSLPLHHAPSQFCR